MLPRATLGEAEHRSTTRPQLPVKNARLLEPCAMLRSRAGLRHARMTAKPHGPVSPPNSYSVVLAISAEKDGYVGVNGGPLCLRATSGRPPLHVTRSAGRA
jgi:hypothetical protein